MSTKVETITFRQLVIAVCPLLLLFLCLPDRCSMTQQTLLTPSSSITRNVKSASVIVSSGSGGIIQRPKSGPSLFLSNLPTRCPPMCICDVVIVNDQPRKRVSCTSGGMDHIPTHQMDRETQIIRFTGTLEKPNDVSLGRIFVGLEQLEEVTITWSNIPAIGDSSFWPGRHIRLIDLSHNKIRIIRDSDFTALTNLNVLNLSDNLLDEIPSAPFRFLSNLTELNLRKNRISKLVPRFFFQLEKLEILDISENPLINVNISSDTFKDIGRTLKVLKMKKCSIRSISSESWKEFSTLRELYLEENKLQSVLSYEFTPLSNALRILALDDNEISTVRDHAFYGLRLTHLGLSRNRLESLPNCAFCNLLVESLDLSTNRFKSFSSNLLIPISTSLLVLNAGSNSRLDDPSMSIHRLLSPLNRTQIVKISWNRIDDSLPDDTFFKMADSLRTLDLSQNVLSNISSKRWFRSLRRLESLDLSFNKIVELSSEMLNTFDSIESLRSIYLHNNQWSCRRCHVEHLYDWITSRSPSAYFNVCHHKRHSSSNRSMTTATTLSSVSSATYSHCVTCSSPEYLSGRLLHTMSLLELEPCSHDEDVEGHGHSLDAMSRRTYSGNGRIGIGVHGSGEETRVTSVWVSVAFLAISIIVTAIIVSSVTVVYMRYRNRAVYYTHKGDMFCPHRHRHSLNASDHGHHPNSSRSSSLLHHFYYNNNQHKPSIVSMTKSFKSSISNTTMSRSQPYLVTTNYYPPHHHQLHHLHHNHHTYGNVPNNIAEQQHHYTLPHPPNGHHSKNIWWSSCGRGGTDTSSPPSLSAMTYSSTVMSTKNHHQRLPGGKSPPPFATTSCSLSCVPSFYSSHSSSSPNSDNRDDDDDDGRSSSNIATRLITSRLSSIATSSKSLFRRRYSKMMLRKATSLTSKQKSSSSNQSRHSTSPFSDVDLNSSNEEPSCIVSVARRNNATQTPSPKHRSFPPLSSGDYDDDGGTRF